MKHLLLSLIVSLACAGILFSEESMTAGPEQADASPEQISEDGAAEEDTGSPNDNSLPDTAEESTEKNDAEIPETENAQPVKRRVKDLTSEELAEMGQQRLIAAYKKEFAFLTHERDALQEELDALAEDGEKRVTSLQALVGNLEKTLLILKDESEELEKELIAVQNKNAETEDVSEAVFSTLSQAAVTMESYSVDPAQFETSEEREVFPAIGRHFHSGLERLKSLASIGVEEGSYYLADGTETTGSIIRIGSVAALGISPAGGGTLAPAGSGKLKIWNELAVETARQLSSGQQPGLLQLYLYESLDKVVQKQHKKTWGEIIKSGGVIAYVIVVLGWIGVFLVVLRVLLLWRSSSNTSSLIGDVTPLVRSGDKEEALQHCQAAKGAASRVLATTISHLDYDPGQLEDIIAESILHETPRLDQFRSSIKVFAAVAPLLGLLGTVTGMISTFDVITIYGTGDPKLLSGGISEALVTTQLGLMVAIPLLLIGNLLSGWSESIKSAMENSALRITNISKGYEPLSAENGSHGDAAPDEDKKKIRASGPDPAETSGSAE